MVKAARCTYFTHTQFYTIRVAVVSVTLHQHLHQLLLLLLLLRLCVKIEFQGSAVRRQRRAEQSVGFARAAPADS